MILFTNVIFPWTDGVDVNLREWVQELSSFDHSTQISHPYTMQ